MFRGRSARLRALATAGLVTATGVATVLLAPSAQAAPAFQLPFECGQEWRLDTWAHSPALDMVREPNQVGTEGAALVAPAAGTVNQSFYHDNAGNMIQINHGGGHFTTYLHLQSRAVSVGAKVTRGQRIGKVGKTGPTSNGHPHLHYEQGFDSDGNGSATWGYAGAERVAAKFDGTTYTGSSRTWRDVASANCTEAPDLERVSDFSGDGHSDVLGVNAAGELWYYPNNGLNLSTGTAKQLGHGWGSFKHVMSADFSGDGHADVLGVNAAGDLWYYPNNGLSLSSDTAKKIGQGWDTFSHVMSADFNGDARADVLGVNAAGELWFYPSENRGISTDTAKQIGRGWGSFQHVMSADFSGDGYADVIGVNAAGELWYYPNNGLNLSTDTAKKIGQGWGSFSQVFASDFSGDGYADIIGVNSAGELWFYPSKNRGISTDTAKQIGRGWNSFSHVM
ncbi:FG-GAP-like repeat-containing protein [Actinophytocola sediminis]